MDTQKKLSQLQKNILRIALARGGRVETWYVRDAIFGRTFNERAEQTQASTIARAVSRLNARGLTRRHYVGGIALTEQGAVIAAQLIQNQTKEKQNATGL